MDRITDGMNKIENKIGGEKPHSVMASHQIYMLERSQEYYLVWPSFFN